MSPDVEIVSHGRSGVLHYKESPHTHTFDWELGGGDVVMTVYVPTPSEWDAAIPWAVGRRAEILERLGRKLCRQQFPRGTFEIEARWISVRESRSAWRVVAAWIGRLLGRGSGAR